MITVKDIREKEFGHQKHGYHEDEVDDFLDEIADQMEELIREIRGMTQKVEEAEAARAKAEAALVEAAQHASVVEPAAQAQRTPTDPHAPEKAAPAAEAPSAQPINDTSYFKNLETAMREALLSAQRLADDTVKSAKQKADESIAEAEKKAEELRLTAEIETEALREKFGKDTEEAQARLDALKESIETHKAHFQTLLEEQLKTLKGDQ